MNVKLRDGVYAIETSSLRLVWTKYERYILHAESLRLVWTNYESYILHTSAVMHTFQNLNTAVNNKSCQKTTQLTGKGWSDKKTIFKY